MSGICQAPETDELFALRCPFLVATNLCLLHYTLVKFLISGYTLVDA